MSSCSKYIFMTFFIKYITYDLLASFNIIYGFLNLFIFVLFLFICLFLFCLFIIILFLTLNTKNIINVRLKNPNTTRWSLWRESAMSGLINSYTGSSSLWEDNFIPQTYFLCFFFSILPLSYS